MEVDMLENIYEVLRESRWLYGMEILRIVVIGENKISTGRILKEKS
jgi:hypothetical protein